MELLAYLAGEGADVWNAPIIFISAVVLAGLVAYGLARWAFSARFEAITERLKLKDDQLADRDRKLNALAHVIESPLPAVLANADAGEDYSAVIRQLTQRFILEQKDPTLSLIAGAELPPRDWMNDELASMGKPWRIQAVHGGVAEIGIA